MLEAGIKTEKGEDAPIYDDLGDYKPRKEDAVKREGDHRRDRREDRDRRDDDRRRDREHDRGRDRERYDRDRADDHRGGEREEDRSRRNYFDRSEQEPEEHRGGFSAEDKQMIKNLIKKQEEKDKAKVGKLGVGFLILKSASGLPKYLNFCQTYLVNLVISGQSKRLAVKNSAEIILTVLYMRIPMH